MSGKTEGTLVENVEQDEYVVRSNLTGNFLVTEAGRWSEELSEAKRFENMSQANDCCFRMNISNYRVVTVYDAFS